MEDERVKNIRSSASAFAGRAANLTKQVGGAISARGGAPSQPLAKDEAVENVARRAEGFTNSAWPSGDRAASAVAALANRAGVDDRVEAMTNRASGFDDNAIALSSQAVFDGADAVSDGTKSVIDRSTTFADRDGKDGQPKVVVNHAAVAIYDTMAVGGELTDSCAGVVKEAVEDNRVKAADKRAIYETMSAMTLGSEGVPGDAKPFVDSTTALIGRAPAFADSSPLQGATVVTHQSVRVSNEIASVADPGESFAEDAFTYTETTTAGNAAPLVDHARSSTDYSTVFDRETAATSSTGSADCCAPVFELVAEDERVVEVTNRVAKNPGHAAEAILRSGAAAIHADERSASDEEREEKREVDKKR